MSKIIAAAEEGKVKTLKSLLAKDNASEKLLKTDIDGFAAVHFAAMNGNVECLELLLEAGAKADIRSVTGVEPLLLAAQNAQIECCELLLKHGAKIDAVDMDGWSALLYAAQEADAETIDFLIEDGKADPLFKDRESWTALHFAGQGGLDIIRLLVEKYKVNLDLRTNQGSTVLHISCESGDYDVVEWVWRYEKKQIKKQLRLQQQQQEQGGEAEENGTTSTTAMKSSADASTTSDIPLQREDESDVSGSALFDPAGERKKSRLVELEDAYGFRPLHSAASAEDDRLDIVRLLISKFGADVFAKTRSLSAEEVRRQFEESTHVKSTLASRRGSLAGGGTNSRAASATSHPVDMSLNKNYEAVGQKTALEIAREHGNEKVAAYLEKIMENRSSVVSRRDTPEGDGVLTPGGSSRKRLVSIVNGENSTTTAAADENNNKNNNIDNDAYAHAIKKAEEKEKEIANATNELDELLLRSKFENASRSWSRVIGVSAGSNKVDNNNNVAADNTSTTTSYYVLNRALSLGILIKMFPEESSFDFTRELKQVSAGGDVITFDDLLRVAKKVVLGEEANVAVNNNTNNNTNNTNAADDEF